MKKWWIVGVIFCALVLLNTSCQSSESSSRDVARAAVPKPDIDSMKTKEETPQIIPDSTITLEYLMGQFDPAKDQRFVKIAAPYAQRAGLLLRQEAYAKFVAMAEAAAKEEIQLTILSATRNFNRQKSIWEAKWTGVRKVDGKNLAQSLKNPVERARKILNWSSMPGSSRHHWGTDIDINALENAYFSTGRGQKEYQWLQKHAHKFGFCQPYSPKDDQRPNGYNEEKWHWSYLPLALPLTQQAQLRLKNETITGFKGAETSTEIDIVKNYVLGINKACL